MSETSVGRTPDAAKVCVITGATSGLGLETARGLSALGYRIAAVARNPERLTAALSVIAGSGGPAPEGFLAELTLLSEVRRLSGELTRRYPAVDVLVNNAGAMFMRREETAEGSERTLALNVLTPFLLTSLLLPALRAVPEARVVNLASAAHRTARLHVDDLDGRRRFRGWSAYSQSKLELILLTREFARRETTGRVTFNACHPGFVRTRFAQNNPGIIGPVFRFLTGIGGISPARAARQSSLFLASAPELAGRTGGYYVRGRPAKPSARASDPVSASRLWEAVAGRCGL